MSRPIHQLSIRHLSLKCPYVSMFDTCHGCILTLTQRTASRTDTSPLATINATINTSQPVTSSRMTPVIPEFSMDQELALWDQNSDNVKRARDYQLSLENEVSQISLAIGRLVSKNGYFTALLPKHTFYRKCSKKAWQIDTTTAWSSTSCWSTKRTSSNSS